MSGLCLDTTWGLKGGHRDRREQAVPPFMAEKKSPTLSLSVLGVLCPFSAPSVVQPFLSHRETQNPDLIR